MKRFLLDTCVISDARTNANAGLTEWLAATDATTLYIAVISIGEIAWGIERLPAGRKRSALEGWLRDDLARAFAGRILQVDLAVAAAWGRVRAAAERHGNNADSLDTLVAAIALHHDLVVVTRNEKVFAGTGVALMNPWSLGKAAR